MKNVIGDRIQQTCAVRIMTARGNRMAMPVANARRAAGDILHRGNTSDAQPQIEEPARPDPLGPAAD